MIAAMDRHPPHVTSFVHIGLVVEDLDETVRFLSLLGFDCSAPSVHGGEWIDRIIGLEKDYEIETTSSPSGVTHVTFTRAGG